MYRVRALSQNNEIGNWTPLNPLFKEYIDILEDVCGIGVTKTNLENYVCRDDDFENEYVKKICIRSSVKQNKMSTISGYVGKGKTTFINYIREFIIHKEYPEIITLYIDLTSLSEDHPDLFESRLIKTIELKIQKILKISSFELMVKYLNYNGYNVDKVASIANEYNNHISVYNILLFFEQIALSSFKKIIFFFDNIDENKRETVHTMRYQLRELNSFFTRSFNTLSTLIIISLRDYNKRFFSENFNKTYQIPDVPLPEADFAGVVKSILTNMRNEIEAVTSEYNQFIYFGRYYRTEARYTITKKSIVMFLNKFIDILFKNEKAHIEYLHTLSAGNLKILASNILNILQSKNLPLTNLFDFILNPNTDIIEVKLTKHELLQCLMAIRYPYYDIEASNLINIFNINSSHNRYDHYNIFLILRMLFYVYNHRNFDITFKKVKEELLKLNYNGECIDLAVNKCFGKGLFQTKFGINLSQVDQEKDFIKLSICGKNYLEDIIFQFSYLQYVCEDTPVSPQYCVSINSKYYIEDSTINKSEKDYKANRIKSVTNFIEFIIKQENNEIESLKKRKINIPMFLSNYSFRENGEGIKISEKIKSRVYEEIDRIN